jgi:hypothetical protein
MKNILSILIISLFIGQTVFGQNSIKLNQGVTYLRIIQKGGKFGLCERGAAAKIILPIEYDKMEVVNRSFFLLSKEGKFGVADSMGKFVVPLKYEKINSFRNGVALVKRDGKFGYMNVSGVEIIAPQYDAADEFFDAKSNRNKDVARVEKDKKFGFVNIKGEVVLEPSLEEMQPESEGLILAKKDGKYGYMNPSNNWIIQPSYNKAMSFSNGKARVYSPSGKIGLINRNGSNCIDTSMDDISNEAIEGVFIVKKGGLNGYIDSNGKILTPIMYSNARPFKEGKAVVEYPQNAYTGKPETKDPAFKAIKKKELLAAGFGYINRLGQEFLPPYFKVANDFKNGIAIVVLKTGESGYLDKYGKFNLVK